MGNPRACVPPEPANVGGGGGVSKYTICRSGLYTAGNAAAFWSGDAYPAPGATPAIGMTMGCLVGRHAAARLRSATT